jgi:hypothetical protein
VLETHLPTRPFLTSKRLNTLVSRVACKSQSAHTSQRWLVRSSMLLIFCLYISSSHLRSRFNSLSLPLVTILVLTRWLWTRTKYDMHKIPVASGALPIIGKSSLIHTQAVCKAGSTALLPTNPPPPFRSPAHLLATEGLHAGVSEASRSYEGASVSNKSGPQALSVADPSIAATILGRCAEVPVVPDTP